MKAFISLVLFALFRATLGGKLNVERPAQSQASAPTGIILMNYFYCDIPCEDKMAMYLGSTSGTDIPRRIQTFLPPAPVGEREFTSFSTWDQSTKIYTAIAADFPRKSVLTLWASSVSGTDAASMLATPIITALEVPYPISSSPAPLNNAPLTLAKVIAGPNGGLLAIFTNGEVHALDSKAGTLTFLHKLIADSRAVDVDFPSTASAHVFDFDRNGLWSVVSAGVNAYVIFTDFATNTVGEWVQMNANMKLDPGKEAMETDFSPEFFINAMMVEGTDGLGKRLFLQLESLNNVGFDLLTFVNTTTGVFEGPVYNLMNYNLVFECQSFNCDMDRISTFDPVSKTVWFQAHIAEGDDAGNMAVNALTFDTAKIVDQPTYYVWTPNPDAQFGLTNFQFYQY